jgi:hypothetical protein
MEIVMRPVSTKLALLFFAVSFNLSASEITVKIQSSAPSGTAIHQLRAGHGTAVNGYLGDNLGLRVSSGNVVLDLFGVGGPVRAANASQFVLQEATNARNEASSTAPSGLGGYVTLNDTGTSCSWDSGNGYGTAVYRVVDVQNQDCTEAGDWGTDCVLEYEYVSGSSCTWSSPTESSVLADSQGYATFDNIQADETVCARLKLYKRVYVEPEFQVLEWEVRSVQSRTDTIHKCVCNNSESCSAGTQ